jgi:hypothetical protein
VYKRERLGDKRAEQGWTKLTAIEHDQKSQVFFSGPETDQRVISEVFF